MELTILEMATKFVKQGDWKSAMGLVVDNWDNYEEIIEPYEDELMDLFEMCSLDCCLEMDWD